MPTLSIRDGEIHYEVHGSGYPLMIFAPGGLLGARLLAAQPIEWVGSRGLDGPDGRAVKKIPGRRDRSAQRFPLTHTDRGEQNLVQTWAKGIREERPEIDKRTLRRFGENMIGGDFVFSVTPEFVRQSQIPMLVMPGNDRPHPTVIGEEIVELAPNVEVLRQWKGPDHLRAAIERVTQFLERLHRAEERQ